MDGSELVTDPRLMTVLQAAETVRAQSLILANMIADLRADVQGIALDEEQLALSRERSSLHARLALLRSLNRRAVSGIRAAKQETAEARQEVDDLHLELQNLYYEQSHLRGEILACQRHSHKYRDLPMISTEDFLLLRPEHRDSSEHEITILQIQHESMMRSDLHKIKEKLKKKKQGLLSVTMTKKDDLSKLDTAILDWFAGYQSISETLQRRDKASLEPIK